MAAPIWRIADAHFRVPYRWPGYFRQRDGWVPGTRTEVPAGAAEGEECVSVQEKEENRPRGLETPREWRYPCPGPADRGRARGGDRTSAGVLASGEATAVVRDGGGE